VDAIVGAVLLRQPSSCEENALVTSFGAIVGSGTEERYNLATGYGDYLLDVVKLLGTNQALDAAVAAVTEAHSLYVRKQTVTFECLQLYNTALRSLRLSLDDPIVAHSDATLCAVMVLMVCQVGTPNCTLQMRSLTARAGLDGHAQGLLYQELFHWAL